MPDMLKLYKGSSANLGARAVEDGALLVTTDNGGIYVDDGGNRVQLSGQSDWNQNDETSIDYVKNRTHYLSSSGVKQLDDIYIPDTIARVSDIPSLDGYATEEYVENLYTTLNSNTVLAFYCIEDVTVVINDIPKVYPANSNVEVRLVEGDSFEIVPTSDSSILSLNAFPGALGTFYSWLEGVSQFSNILFDMNDEAMYTKWSQGNQGAYHVQAAQYTNCIFWSDNGYISDVSKRTNYTLTNTSQLPLCYSTIPDNTFKAFYLAFGVNSDPNWSNPVYKDSFSKATWATQVFSYYGARTIGIVGHDDPDFNITLPPDCRGLMFDAGCIENAGTFDAINCTNLGAKSGSWREAFGRCFSLRRLYIKNLKVSLNVSWSPIDYDSIAYIISAAANTSSITISVSPYTYNLLSQSDFDLAASKNITIELITTNYVEDKRLSAVDSKADKSEVEELAATKQDATMVVTATENVASHHPSEMIEWVNQGNEVVFKDSTVHLYLEGSTTVACFYSNYFDERGFQYTVILVDNDKNVTYNRGSIDVATQAELNSVAETVASHTTQLESYKTETWTFTLTDGSVVTKSIVVV